MNNQASPSLTEIQCHQEKYPKKSFAEQISLLESKGINFDRISKEEAKEILKDSNYYYKLTVYKRNFHRDIDNKFVDLDFSSLVDLARLDMQLRYLLLRACLDIEHALKTYVLTKITDNNELDGYDIAKRFFHSTTNRPRPISETSIMERANNDIHYQYNLFTTHKISPAIWVLMEVISFGDFLGFFRFYFRKYPEPKMDIHSMMGVLNGVRKIRNAAAHNNAILFNSPDATIDNVSNILKKYANDLEVDSLPYNQNKTHDILCVFYIHKFFVKGEHSKNLFIQAFSDYIADFEDKLSYMDTNEHLTVFLEVLRLV